MTSFFKIVFFEPPVEAFLLIENFKIWHYVWNWLFLHNFYIDWDDYFEVFNKKTDELKKVQVTGEKIICMVFKKANYFILKLLLCLDSELQNPDNIVYHIQEIVLVWQEWPSRQVLLHFNKSLKNYHKICKPRIRIIFGSFWRSSRRSSRNLAKRKKRTNSSQHLSTRRCRSFWKSPAFDWMPEYRK